MAWFSNLADRAENILNKIDQNAATVLNENTVLDTNKKRQQEIDTKLIEPLMIGNDAMEIHSELKPPFKAKDVEEPNSTEDYISFKEPVEEQDATNVFEKFDLHSSRSSSLHNSFIVSEDVQNYVEKLNRCELENIELSKQLLNLQHLYSEMRNENANLRSQVETSNYLVTTAQSEMEQYKARSHRILQEKEELITIKKQSTPEDDNDNAVFIKYNNELKKELEFQQNKNVELMDKIARLTQESSYFQQEIMALQNTSQTLNQTMQQSLATENKIRSMIEEECRLKTRELQLKTEELHQQLVTVKEQNEELRNLKQMLRNKSSLNTNDDLDTRIKSLTETLMMKQHTLETVTTERNALRIQLEKLETEYHNNLAQLERAQIRVINMNDTDDVKSQVPQFMKPSPLDAGVTRRMKRAYSTVDAISVRTGIFLRRYPLARVLVFCYMVFLQLWALIVLFLYAPSNH